MRRSLDNALDLAIERADITPMERLKLSLLLAFNRRARKAVIAFIRGKAAEEPTLAASNFDFPAIDIDEFEKWIQLIIKYLPQIIALIEALFP